MRIGKVQKLTPMARAFLQPVSAVHRQYEALRAYFVEGLPSKAAAERFSYTPASFRVLCCDFKKNPQRAFFVGSRRTPRIRQADRIRAKIVALRKQNCSVYDISLALGREDIQRSPAAVGNVLHAEGFARLPRRCGDERSGGPLPEVASVADCRALDLSPRDFRTRFGGLFIFLPYLASLPFDQVMDEAGLPGTKMIPAGHAMRALLALKLFARRRHSHVMSDVFDDGLALFAGLNVTPKRSFLTEYSCRVDPRCYAGLMRRWFDAMSGLGLRRGSSFDCDFHTIPFHGEDALMEKHYVSKRSRRQKGVLAFLAQDADQRVFCYANCDLRKDQQADEIMQFISFWKQRTGHFPEELVFDSKLTTYANLDKINKLGIRFITLRRRSREMVHAINQKPLSAWRRIELNAVGRAYRTPRILDHRVALPGYSGDLRQLTITDLGHEEPTLLVTNQLRRSAARLVERYAQRMLIENGIQDGVDFFHMDALSSAVALKVNLDLQLTLMASSLYRILGTQIGRGYESAKSQHIFHDFVEASATVSLSPGRIDVHLQRRAHDPQLIAANLQDRTPRVPWLGGRSVHLHFG